MGSIGSIANTDKTANLDDNNRLNRAYYFNATVDIIEREAQNENYDLTKINANKLRAYLRVCYHSLFEPEQKTIHNYASIIPYNEDNILILLNIYIEVCEHYSCIPSLIGFERYSGIQEDTVKKYVTRATSLLCKMRKDFVQNKLSDTPIGVTVLANNDSDTGLMYNRQNMIERETVKQGLTLNDFVKISQNTDK